MSVLEAMALGTIPIVSEVSSETVSVEELVVDGFNNPNPIKVKKNSPSSHFVWVLFHVVFASLCVISRHFSSFLSRFAPIWIVLSKMTTYHIALQ